MRLGLCLAALTDCFGSFEQEAEDGVRDTEWEIANKSAIYEQKCGSWMERDMTGLYRRSKAHPLG